MNEQEAIQIAREFFWQGVRCRAEMPEAYEFIVTESDLSDEQVDEAFAILFHGEIPAEVQK